jgi:hypothetical protein
MKLIYAIITGLSLSVATLGYIYFEPMFERHGTAVIAAKDGEVKGGKKYTVVLPKDLSMAQMALLNFAYEVAVQDGIKHPEYLQGLLMQESMAGAMKSFRVAGQELGNKADDLYFGVAQIKLKAAKDVMNRWPELWSYLQTKTDHELMAKLILDDKFNVRVGSKYLLLMGINESGDKGIAAYNQGPGGVAQIEDPSKFHYTAKVKQYASRIKKIGAKISSAE